MKKIGMWMPLKPQMRRADAAHPAIFLEPVGRAIREALGTQFELVEGLDLKEASVRDGTVFFGDRSSEGLDGYLWFGFIDKDPDGTDIQALRQLGRRMPVFNAAQGLEVGLDKFKTSSFLQAHGVPVAPYALLRAGDERAAKALIASWGEALIKPRYGSFGLGIVRVDDADRLLDIIDLAGMKEAYVERFCPNDMARWCGVNVVGGEVLYGYGKKAQKVKDYKVFDRSQVGGEMVNRPPDSAQTAIALQVSRCTGLGFFGVDIIHTLEGENLVVDLNTFPGIYPDMIEPDRVGAAFVRMVRRGMGGGSEKPDGPAAI